MEVQKLNEDLQSQIAEYVLKLSSFGLNILKKREANCQSISDLLDPNKWKGKNGYSLAKNRTRIQENGKNTFLKSSRQTRGRPKKQTLNDSLDAPADIDSEVSIRSTRRAAQIADMKNKSYMAINLTKKLRRPTNIKGTTTIGSNRLSELVVSPIPYAKYRRTHKKQSAGSSYEKAVKTTQNVLLCEANTIQNEEGNIKELENEIIENLNTKIITIQEKSDESQKGTPTRLNITPTMEEKKSIKAMILKSVGKDSKSYKQLISNAVVVIVNDHKIQKDASAISDSGISEEDNRCHSDHSNNINTLGNTNCKKKNLRTPLCKNEKQEDVNVNEVGGIQEIETEATKRQFRTKVVEKAVVSHEYDDDDKLDKREPVGTKTKTTIKKKIINGLEVDAEPSNLRKEKQIIQKDIVTNEVELGIGKEISDVEPRNLKTRTKVISKPVLVVSNENNKTKEVSENENIEKEASNIRKRTNLTKRVKSEDDIFVEANNSFNETRDVSEKNNTQSRNIITKKKNNNIVMVLTNGQAHFDDVMTSSEKSVRKAVTHSALTHTQSETVKKRVEEFEKINIIDKGISVDISCGRVTRTKTRAMVAASAVTDTTVIVDQLNDVLQEYGKENMQSSMTSNHHGDGKSDKERVRGTPLANYNRFLIGHVDSSKKQNFASKSATSANRGIPFIHKTPSEEIKTKRKEEKIVKKKEKTDKATKNKEETLKATAEETRRKREEKLQKAAAAREAAEKEKAALAVKHEKEKEEKIKQIQLEKEKLREEIAKKKLISHQKLLENEERRKQEEAARLAKIKEQEEEQKRLQANREKEQETAERLNQKRHLEELRAKEAEKLKKNKNCKLIKVAAVNAAKLKQGVKTGTNMVSYEMTPDRDERPILNPKRPNDYGIDDAQTDDSSDDEKKPKKRIPSWAEAKNRKKGLYFQKFIPMVCWNKLVTSNPKPVLEAIFSEDQLPLRSRQRTSSAVWSFVPLSSKMISS